MFPKAHKVPSDFTIIQMLKPTDTSTQLVSVPTRTGTARLYVLPTLKMPNEGFFPQTHKLPSRWMPAALTPPARIFVQLVPNPIRTGTGLVIEALIPSRQAPSAPQAQREPSFFNA